MQISSKQYHPVPGQPPARPTHVQEVAYDCGEEYYNDKKTGELKARPAEHGLIYVNKTSLEAAEKKIEAIQNRLADEGVKADENGNQHFRDAKSGEVYDVHKEGDTTTFSQSTPTHESHWLGFQTIDNLNTESFTVKGDDVHAADTNHTTESIGILFFHKTENTELTQSWDYKRSPEGFLTKRDNEWKLVDR